MRAGGRNGRAPSPCYHLRGRRRSALMRGALFSRARRQSGRRRRRGSAAIAAGRRAEIVFLDRLSARGLARRAEPSGSASVARTVSTRAARSKNGNRRPLLAVLITSRTGGVVRATIRHSRPSPRSATRTGRMDRSGRGAPRRPAARARTAGRARCPTRWTRDQSTAAISRLEESDQFFPSGGGAE